MVIIVVWKQRVFGPFANDEDAARWVTRMDKEWGGIFTITHLEDPLMGTKDEIIQELKDELRSDLERNKV
jgi:hypothetical protein